MNPIQNLVSRSFYAKAPKQSDPSIEQKLAEIQAKIDKQEKITKVGRRLVTNVILPLRKWAHDTIVLVKKSRLLSAFEKREVIQKLTDRIDYLDYYLGPEQLGENIYVSTVERLKDVINDWLVGQARLNKDMKWFELPPYQLPDHIQPQPSPWQDRHSFKAFHNKMNPMIKQGDVLYCTILEWFDFFKKGGVVCVVHRPGKNKRSVRQYSFGRVKIFTSTYITLGYDNPYYREKYHVIPLSNVSFVLRVEEAQTPSNRVK